MLNNQFHVGGISFEQYQNSIRDLGFLISIFNSFFLKFTLIELVNECLRFDWNSQ